MSTPKRWKELQSSLDNAKTERAKHEPAWREFWRQYTHRTDAGGASVPTRKVRTGLAFSTVEIMVAAGFVEDPKIFVKPRREAEIVGAKIVEAVLDYWWPKYNVQDQIMKADRDSKVFGHGWCKTIWRHATKTGRQITPPPQMVDDAVEQINSGIASGALDADMAPTRDQVERYYRQQMSQIAFDEPQVRRVSPWDIWVDPAVVDWDQRRWVDHRYWRRYEEVRSDKTYNQGRLDAEASAMESSDGITSISANTRTSMAMSDSLLRVEIHELWDLEDEKLYVCTPGVEKPLFYDDWPNAIGQPFTFFPCFDVPDAFYPEGVIERLGSKIWESDELIREQILSRRRQHQQYMIRKRHSNAHLKKVLESGQDGAVAEMEDSNEPLKEILFPIPMSPVNPELYRQEQMLEQRASKELGITEYERGYADQVRTATEVDTISRFGTARTAAMHNHLRDGMENIARHLIGLAQENMTTKDVVRLIGRKEYNAWLESTPDAFADGDEMVVPFGRRDISGEFDFKITPSSAQPDSEQLRRQQLMNFAQIALPLPFVNGPAVMKEVASQLGIMQPERFVLDPEQTAAKAMIQGGGGAAPQSGSPPALALPAVAGSGGTPPGAGENVAQNRAQAAKAGMQR